MVLVVVVMDGKIRMELYVLLGVKCKVGGRYSLVPCLFLA